MDFISLLNQHIPEPYYKITHCYGLYVIHPHDDKQFRKVLHQSKHNLILSYSKWRYTIATSFGYDPLCCSKCKATMTLTDLYFKHKLVSLEEMYERSIAESNAVLLDLSSCLLHTVSISRQGGTIMDSKALEELLSKYIKNPPEGMTAKLVKYMSDSGLLDMHYFLTEDDAWHGDEPEEGFYIDRFQ